MTAQGDMIQTGTIEAGRQLAKSDSSVLEEQTCGRLHDEKAMVKLHNALPLSSGH